MEINNAKISIKSAKICEEIFDSVTIYMHITTQEIDNLNAPRKILSRLSFSNVPFTDERWKNKLHHLEINEIQKDSEDNTIDLSYNIHKKLMLDLAYILTLRGHEVFVCVSQNPSQNNGNYSHMSKDLKNALIKLKEPENEIDVGQKS